MNHNLYKTIIKQRIFLSLLWPFGGLLISIREFRYPYAKNLFWWFCIFFGLTFIVATGPNSADSARYAESLVKLHQANITSISEVMKGLYSDEGKTLDIYQSLMTFIVSRFTGNPQFLFLSYALVFGFFYSRTLWYVFDKIKGNIRLYLVPIMILYALVCPIWNINGVRMWTALQIFVYGALPYLLDGNPKKLYWSVASVLFHFSFFIPVVILFSFQFLPKKWSTFYFVFFLLTSFIKEINIGAITNFATNHMPAFLAPRIESYTNSDYIQNQTVADQNLAFHVILANNIAHYFIYIMVIAIWLKGKDVLNNHLRLKQLFNYSLYSYGIAQILALIPSGGRFVSVANMFMYAFLVLFIHVSSREISLIRRTIQFSMPFLIFAIIFQIWAGMLFWGPNTLIGNPVTAFMTNDATPFMTLIKQWV
ncbi:EpsG family protein [Microbacter margulisiae]|uniref:EpsG family protein n=1 Tax=Microbacter margulisiae TaxID=1350067 RepID=A0A7W5DNC4_9PORP|nr:EpsG family protein [Microbacter margulisiae]MBB3185992.1 hypothetical protein [Microbacter margulisiae]